MKCVLCHQGIDLFDLDPEGIGGMPAHHTCADAYRAAAAEVLAEAEAMVLAEPDPRRHRHPHARLA